MKNTLTGLVSAGVLLTFAFSTMAQGGPPPSKGGAPPFAGAANMTCEEALKETPKDDPTLAPLDKAYKDAGAKLKKSPKDAKVKKAFVEAVYKYEDKVLKGDVKLKPPVKYRAALALDRKGLAVDPKFKPLLDDKKLVEDTYGSMGRPIPK